MKSAECLTFVNSRWRSIDAKLPRTDVLPEIVRRLVAEFDPEEIILFGSRAWGQPGLIAITICW